MRRLIGILVSFFILGTIGIVAQESQPNVRDYVITSVDRSFSDDGAELYLDVSIENQGSDALSESDLNVILLDGEEERIIASEPLQLNADEPITQRFILRVEDFSPGSVQVFQIEAGIDLYELDGSPLAEDNIAQISVEIPASGGRGSAANFPDADFVIPVVNIPITFGDGETIIGDTTLTNTELALYAGGVVLAIVVLGIILLVIRLLFRKPPRFEAWQPPYAGVPHIDPNSTSGRRQAWQGHAQNGSILAACSDNSLHPIKLLMSMDQMSLDGWQITAMRLSQYDMYGRVARSQVIAAQKTIKLINRAIQRRGNKPDAHIKPLRSATRQLIKPLRKNLDKRNAMLPIAMDVRFAGRHGEVRILFELYQCQGKQWQLIDSWEPEMTVIGRNIQESYTYTIHGMGAGEDLKSYRSRLEDDLLWLLTEMLRPRQPGYSAPVEDNVPPDTLTDMKPIVDF